MYREEWLNAALNDHLRPLFAEQGHPLPDKVRVSVGWPGGRGPKRNTIGQCWPPSTVEDGIAALFVSPTLTDPARVLDVLVHEGVHAALEENMGHRKEFSQLAKALGLVKPWTHTTASPELAEKLREIAKTLGEYDHGGIKTSAIIRQTTRLLKVVCPKKGCGYTARITRKWIDKGLPFCYDGTEMEEA